MKPTKLIASFFTLTFLILLISSCGGSGDPATYNNKLMELVNSNEQHINAMNQAMNTKDYKKAEEVRKGWETDLTKNIEAAGKAGDFKGNSDFEKAVVNGLNAYKKIVTQDYKSLIELRSNQKGDAVSSASSETALLDNINKTLEETANGLNKASADFETKFAK